MSLQEAEPGRTAAAAHWGPAHMDGAWSTTELPQVFQPPGKLSWGKPSVGHAGSRRAA